MTRRITDEVESLKNQVSHLTRIVEACGLPISPWLTPAEAAKILGISRDRLITEIQQAEQARLGRSKYPFIYGKHYRNIADANGNRPTWQINLAQAEQYFRLPPELRG
jgi:crotonobetainyl-CoA:carnitine CoA-transferase CaiB-like acyl-CoA transferase